MTTTGDAHANDWACRNDGYSGHVVASAGEAFNGGKGDGSFNGGKGDGSFNGGKGDGSSTSVDRTRAVNNALASLVLTPLKGDNLIQQTSRPSHTFKPKRNGLQENMTINYGGDPFMNSVTPIFETDAGNPNPYANRAGHPEGMNEGMEGTSFAERNKSVNRAMEMLEDIDYNELSYIDETTAEAIKGIELAREGDISALMTAADNDPVLQADLSVIDSAEDISKLNNLLNEKLAKYKTVMLVSALKEAGREIDPSASLKEIEAIYREVQRGRRVSKVVGPYPHILAPNECDYEGKWTNVMPYNACQPSLVGALGTTIKETFTSVLGKLVGSPEPCGKNGRSGATRPMVSNYCKTKSRMPPFGEGAKFIGAGVASYKALEDHCANDYNHNGGNDRQPDGGAWRDARYKYGCNYPLI
jgi:hypothetical protein